MKIYEQKVSFRQICEFWASRIIFKLVTFVAIIETHRLSLDLVLSLNRDVHCLLLCKGYLGSKISLMGHWGNKTKTNEVHSRTT